MRENNILYADGFEEALVGIAQQFDRLFAVYDRAKCIQILMRDMNEEDAEEFFEFNIQGSYVGECTPAFVEIINETNLQPQRISGERA